MSGKDQNGKNGKNGRNGDSAEATKKTGTVKVTEAPPPPPEKQTPLEGLLAAVKGVKSLNICAHNNPDPDSLSSSAALKYILEQLAGVKCRIVYDGVIGRAENQAMVKLLHLPLRPLRRMRRLDAVALVDTQPRTGNNPYPQQYRPLVVIDHHPLRKSTAASWIDVRPHYGATATILTEYLEASGLPVPAWLATALAYGVSSETRDLGREAGVEDVKAYLWLFPLVQKKVLARIEHPRLPRSYFSAIDRALHRAFYYRNVIGSKLGRVDNPDIVSEVADFLMAHERMTWCITIGCFQEQLFISLRSTNLKARAGNLMKKLLGKKGTAGGHGQMAGGQVDITDMTPADVTLLEERILQKFLLLLGHNEKAEFRALIVRPEVEIPSILS
jgi:nanoRNase/pAp phosphatase (c-di-AMP/oligoRNAs hydrolase)